MSELFDELIEGLNAYKDFTQGKITLRVETRERIEPASITAEEVKAIREKLNLSQAVFAQKLRTSVRTYQGWEQGKTKPSAHASLLLRMVDKAPQTFELIAGI
ncbi:transcriptional regulator [Haemophilus quentini]|jgi:virulence gene repressor rsaL|uniref:Transcriptional regulator n=4 Tax=Pasteurellaceae TaxID=712 RepID=A0ABX3BRV9_9PAST|nr:MULTISPECIES: helix-turn-helix domain-containing protein [Pasteurellaceae]EGT82797.1 putative regulatory protein [Haemophilus haemolyticus M21639]KNE85719.1 XRE family transcriptional regulator [Aggregatibacter aphrophilus ATCC 33389]NYA47896.1 helix-turn-helix domain-containing protein [Haemophilus haemolyticus]OBY51527.1 transcriptional regulator [Aggregatibacter aphrophilus]OEY76525.1 transcriptional regulator [Haemophilus quentini]